MKDPGIQPWQMTKKLWDSLVNKNHFTVDGQINDSFQEVGISVSKSQIKRRLYRVSSQVSETVRPH